MNTLKMAAQLGYLKRRLLKKNSVTQFFYIPTWASSALNHVGSKDRHQVTSSGHQLMSTQPENGKSSLGSASSLSLAISMDVCNLLPNQCIASTGSQHSTNHLPQESVFEQRETPEVPILHLKSFFFLYSFPGQFEQDHSTFEHNHHIF